MVNKPQLLVRDGVINYEKLKKCNVHIGDLKAKLREAKVHQMEEVKAVVFESTGDISVLYSKYSVKDGKKILCKTNK